MEAGPPSSGLGLQGQIDAGGLMPAPSIPHQPPAGQAINGLAPVSQKVLESMLVHGLPRVHAELSLRVFKGDSIQATLHTFDWEIEQLRNQATGQASGQQQLPGNGLPSSSSSQLRLDPQAMQLLGPQPDLPNNFMVPNSLAQMPGGLATSTMQSLSSGMPGNMGFPMSAPQLQRPPSAPGQSPASLIPLQQQQPQQPGANGNISNPSEQAMAAGGGGPGDAGGGSGGARMSQQQQLSIFFQAFKHAKMCPQPEGMCPVPACAQLKRLHAHMATCTAMAGCPYPRCMSTKALLARFRRNQQQQQQMQASGIFPGMLAHPNGATLLSVERPQSNSRQSSGGGAAASGLLSNAHGHGPVSNGKPGGGSNGAAVQNTAVSQGLGGDGLGRGSGKTPSVAADAESGAERPASVSRKSSGLKRKASGINGSVGVSNGEAAGDGEVVADNGGAVAAVEVEDGRSRSASRRVKAIPEAASGVGEVAVSTVAGGGRDDMVMGGGLSGGVDVTTKVMPRIKVVMSGSPAVDSNLTLSHESAGTVHHGSQANGIGDSNAWVNSLMRDE